MMKLNSFNSILSRVLGSIGFVAALGFAAPAHGYVEFSGFYMSDTLGTASQRASTSMFVEVSGGFAIDRKGDYLVGWNYSMVNTTLATDTTTTYASTQMGPRFIWMIDKHKSWSVGLGYYLITSASFSDGSETSTWRGTAIKFDFGYNVPISEAFMLGLRMNYSSVTYAEKLIGETDYSKVAYTSSQMYPSLYMIYGF